MIYLLFICISILSGEISPGYTLFSPLPSQGAPNYYTYLIDNDGGYINTWVHDCKPVSLCYLLPDSSIVIPCSQNEIEGLGNPNQITGGRILKLSWDGEILWDDIFVNPDFEPHHDIEPLPNGNILFISYERKTALEANLLGRLNVDDEIWPSYIFELEQVGIDSSNIVWEWHLWDHTIQDIDPSLPNYGNISENPGLLDINLGTLGGGGGASGDWIHLNSIDYNSNLDLIAISSRKMNEFYFIDHSTTIEESASSSGGNFNKGGNFIYRWGNPANYRIGNGSSQQLQFQHNVNWIDDSYPGGGDILLFNNRTQELGSQIVQISTPVIDFSYNLPFGQSHGPEAPIWTYDEASFFSNIQSGAQRLCNGNTLISIGDSQSFFEIDSTGNQVWYYTFTGPSGQTFMGNIPRVQKYNSDYMVGDSTYGDLNFDLIVDILDITLLVNYIIDDLIEFNYSDLYDLNIDQNIDILDIISLLNIVLEGLNRCQ